MHLILLITSCLIIFSCTKTHQIQEDIYNDCCIGGIVFDHIKNTPVPGANIFIKESKIGITSDSLGIFALCGILKNNMSIFFGHVQYQNLTLQNIPTKSNNITVIKINLDPDVGWEPIPILLDSEFIPIKSYQIRNVKKQVGEYMNNKANK